MANVNVTVQTPRGVRTIRIAPDSTVHQLRLRAMQAAGLPIGAADRRRPDAAGRSRSNWNVSRDNRWLRDNRRINTLGIFGPGGRRGAPPLYHGADVVLGLRADVSVVYPWGRGERTVRIRPQERVDTILRRVGEGAGEGGVAQPRRAAPVGAVWKLIYDQPGQRVPTVLDDDRTAASYDLTSASRLLVDAMWGYVPELVIRMRIVDPSRLKGLLQGKTRRTGFITLEPSMLAGTRTRPAFLYEPGVAISDAIMAQVARGQKVGDALLERQTWRRLVNEMRRKYQVRRLDSPDTINFILKTFLSSGTELRMEGSNYEIRSMRIARRPNGTLRLPVANADGRYVKYEVSVEVDVRAKFGGVRELLRIGDADCQSRREAIRRNYLLLTDPHTAALGEIARAADETAIPNRQTRQRRQIWQQGVNARQRAMRSAQLLAQRQAAAAAAAAAVNAPAPRPRRRPARGPLGGPAPGPVPGMAGLPVPAAPQGGGQHRHTRKRHDKALRHSRRKPACSGSGTKRKSTRRRFRA